MDHQEPATPPAPGAPTEILFFGVARLATGLQRTSVPLPPDGIPAEELLTRLANTHPALSPYLPSLRVAVNREFARPGQAVQPGDEIALLPPVQGG